MDLALNNIQWLICHKTKINQTITGVDVKIRHKQLKLQNMISPHSTIRNYYVRKKFDSFQETSESDTLSDNYENFIYFVR